MNAPGPDTLHALLDQHGAALCLDHRKVQALLGARFPDRPREAVLLHVGVREGVAADLAADHRPLLPAMVFERLVRRLSSRAGLSRAHASWTVATWAEALDRKVPASGARARGAPVAQKISKAAAVRAVSAPLDLVGHRRPLSAIALRPDGARIATASLDRTVRLWDVRTGEHLRTLFLGHRDWVRDVCFSPDGSLLASVGDDGAIRLWEADTGERQHRLPAHSGRALSADFSPDGRLVASAGDDGTISIFEVASLQRLHTLGPLATTTHRVRFDPAGQWLAIGIAGAVEVWAIDPPQPIRRFEVQAEQPALATGPRDTLLIGDQDGIAVVNAKSGRERVRCLGHAGTVSTLAMHPNGKTFASGGVDQSVRIWHTGSGRQAWRFEPDLQPTGLHMDPHGHLAMAFHENIGKVALLRKPASQDEP